MSIPDQTVTVECLSPDQTVTVECLSPDPDSNCVKMLERGVVPHILNLLEQHVDEGDVSVQHAGLSALRNLAIPGKTRPLHSVEPPLCGVLCGVTFGEFKLDRTFTLVV